MRLLCQLEGHTVQMLCKPVYLLRQPAFRRTSIREEKRA